MTKLTTANEELPKFRSKKEKMFPIAFLAKHVLLYEMKAETNLFQCCFGLGLVCDLNLGQN